MRWLPFLATLKIIKHLTTLRNITYLFGAGASCNCLPTYNNFNKRFSGFIDFVDIHKIQDTLKEDYRDSIRSLYELLIDLKKNLLFHNTPDTLAKKLFHSDDHKSLEDLKIGIILFFLYEQVFIKEGTDPEVKIAIDLRYDSFIAAILKPIPKKIEFSNNIKILTWNYDLQFEIAYSRYTKLNVQKIQEKIQSYPSIASPNIAFQEDNFSIVHLNGIAFSSPDGKFGDADLVGQFADKESIVIKYLLDNFKSLCEKEHLRTRFLQLLSFAWENTNENFTLKDVLHIAHAKTIAAHTHILVINGYSFPIFNRTVDLELFKAMKFLKKIYIQSPKAKDVKGVLEEIANIEGMPFKKEIIIDSEYYNQFYIPDLLNNERKTNIVIGSSDHDII